MSQQTVQETLEFPGVDTGTNPTRKSAVSPTPHACGRCDSRWGGSNTAHCGACHRTFGGVVGFDSHRKDGRCLDPAAIGMRISTGRPYPCWSYPYDHAMPDTDGEESENA